MKNIVLLKLSFHLFLCYFFYSQNGRSQIPELNCLYVDREHPAASDSNPGTINLPWRTISYAFQTATAGDSVIIREGIYQEYLETSTDGNTVSGPIVFSSFPGESVIIDGTESTSSTGIRILHDYIRLYGLIIRNWASTGIWVQNSAFFEIHGCEVYEVYYGIGISGNSHDFLLKNNELHHFSLYGVDASPMGQDYCHSGHFVNCISHTGRDPDQNVDGFALGHGLQYGFTFENCLAYNVYDGFDISASSTTLKNCESHHCGNTCYKLWAHKVELVNCIGYQGDISVVQLGWIGAPTKTTLRNCTFFDAGVYTIWQANSSDTLVIYNSIISGGDNIGLCFENPSSANYYGNNNLFQNNNPDRAINVGWVEQFSISDINQGLWSSYSGQDSQSIAVFSPTDIFVNPDKPDLHPKQQGAAFDNGNPDWAPGFDFHGFSRPIGAFPDIGAFESQLFIWTGTVSDDWESAGNWECNAVPTALSNVLVQESVNDPVLSGEKTVANVVVDPAGVLTIAEQGRLEVSASLTNRSGVNGLFLKSSQSGTGALLHHSSNVPATVERYIPAADWNQWDDGWHLISSPVSNQVIIPEFVTGFTPGGEDFYQWNEPDNTWINIKNDGGNGWTPGFEDSFQIGKGYLIATQSNQTKQFSGLLNYSDIFVDNLTFTSGNGKNRSWNLIGNPYSCGLTWYTGWETENVGGVACLWNEENRSYSPVNPGEIIPHGNGFMVSVSESAGGSLTIPADKRVLSEANWVKSTTVPTIRLFATNKNDHSRQECQVRFHPDATNRFDFELDGSYLAGYAPVFYSVCENNHLMVNCLPSEDIHREIPLYFRKNNGTEFMIHAVVQNVENQVYLVDQQENMIQNISSNPDYSFLADDQCMDDRFRLRIGDVGYPDLEAGSGITLYSVQGKIVFGSTCREGSFELFSITGQRMASYSMSEYSGRHIEIHCVPGCYIGKVQCGQLVYSKQIIVY